MSWDSTVARAKHTEIISMTTWSPCSGFIAISSLEDTGVQILDAATLKTIKRFESGYMMHAIALSPDGILVTCVSLKPAMISCWDLQTSIQVSEIDSGDIQPAGEAYIIVHSACGTKAGVLFSGRYGSGYGYDGPFTVGTYNPITGAIYPAICTYDLLSGVPIFCHPCRELAGDTIWTKGEYIQFVTLAPGTITIWEVGFTSKDSPTQVKSLPTPYGFDLPTPNRIGPTHFVFLPTLSWLAFTFEGAVIVWDAQHSKHLLNSADSHGHIKMVLSSGGFSCNGHFFACETDGPDIYLWKESPTGYILHQILTPGVTGDLYIYLSPNGQSIAVVDQDIIGLLHTTNSTAPPSGVLVPSPQYDKTFILAFSKDRSLAAVGRWAENTVVVLNLKSGVQQLVVDTNMKLSGLGITKDTVIVVGDGKAVSWDIPGDHISNSRASNSDGTQIMTYDYSQFPEQTGIPLASISPDFNYIAVAGVKQAGISIYDMSTGEYLTGVKTATHGLWFTPDGCEVWNYAYHNLQGWQIIKDSRSGLHLLAPSGLYERPSGGCPWEPPHGHQIEDGWIFSSSKRRLLWSPHHWKSHEPCFSMWSGQFLVFFHHGLPDAVILELPME